MKFGGIPFDWVQRHAAGAVRQGASLDTLLSDSMIELRYGDNRDVISPTQHLLLCMNTSLKMGDATHALARVGVDRSIPSVGLRVALGCSNLEGAIQAISRLYALASSSVHIQLRSEQEVAILSIHMDASDDRDAAQLEENYLIWMFMNCLRFLGRAPAVIAVTVRDPSHFNLGNRHWGIGAPVSCGDVTSFCLSRRLLSEGPGSRAGENVQLECHQLWLDFLNDNSPPPALTDFVNGETFVRFSDLARDSGVSPNTLRRQFQSLNGGFREVRQRALVDAALARLRGSDESIETIAVELGYSEGRSLRRLLKTATGLTPMQIRERVDVETATADARALYKIRILSETLNL